VIVIPIVMNLHYKKENKGIVYTNGHYIYQSINLYINILSDLKTLYYDTQKKECAIGG
jgi:hypothetical protein